MTLVRGTRWKMIGLIAGLIVACATLGKFLISGTTVALDLRYESKQANAEAHKQILSEANTHADDLGKQLIKMQESADKRLERIEDRIDRIYDYSKYTRDVLKGEPALNQGR